MHSEISLQHESKVGKLRNWGDAPLKCIPHPNQKTNVIVPQMSRVLSDLQHGGSRCQYLAGDHHAEMGPSAVAAEAGDLYSDDNGFMY